jgi:hypothetical protein
MGVSVFVGGVFFVGWGFCFCFCFFRNCSDRQHVYRLPSDGMGRGKTSGISGKSPRLGKDNASSATVAKSATNSKKSPIATAATTTSTTAAAAATKPAPGTGAGTNGKAAPTVSLGCPIPRNASAATRALNAAKLGASAVALPLRSIDSQSSFCDDADFGGELGVLRNCVALGHWQLLF